MARRLVGCVPNFSEGRKPEIVSQIAAAALTVQGVVLLDQEMDPDHNRSVLTLLGEPEAVLEAAVRATGEAAKLIDLNKHKGVHPRIGATDVVPFIPLENVSIDECAVLAEKAAQAIWERFRIPAYLYGAASKHPERSLLPAVRKGQFEGLREEVKTNPSRHPDFGEAALHPTAGAVAVGARKFLVAYNFQLDTADVTVAQAVARTIRESSGGLSAVRALGFLLASKNVAQVSVNLTDFERTSLGDLYDAVASEAAKHGAIVTSTELIGLLPQRALEMAGAHLLKIEHFRENMVLENRIEELLPRAPLADFLTDLGPGSAAAATAAMASSVAERMARISGIPHDEFTAARKWLADAAVRDAAVYRYALDRGEEEDWVAASCLLKSGNVGSW